MSTDQDHNDDPGLEIPQVPMKYGGIFGNVPDLDSSFIIKSYWDLAALYGPICKLDVRGSTVVLLNNYELINATVDDDLFEKSVAANLVTVRDAVGDGLFTAYNHEQNWFKAHRILVPVFGPIGVRKMFDQQLDIASQMMLRWDRMGPDHRIVAADDFTKLAFDTIGFCAFSYRFNEFYTDNVHPFARQMADVLTEAGKRTLRTAVENKLRFQSNQKYWSDIGEMHKLCQEVLDERVKNPKPEINDLLNVMLNTPDPVTGEKLDATNIKYQMATFLLAGHETTSGTLSFLFHNLLTHPETYHKAQQEVDEVIGDDAITIQHLSKLPYLEACIKETLRYKGPINLIKRTPKKPVKLAGKYWVTPDMRLVGLMLGLHHDPAVWGDDADEFKPERMIPSSKMPPGAYYPFGVGIRSCIGRTFAEQEAILCVALILQRFQVELADPNYVMHLKSTLTIKPDGLELKVKRRPGKSDMVGLQGQGTKAATKQPHKHAQTNGTTKKPMTVLYGSNAGTCKAFADELVAATSAFNVTVRTLDSATEDVPKDQPVVVICPSYEGKPPDNAKKFITWLEHNGDFTDLLKDVQYTVFGVGNSEWSSTFHKVPKTIDASFSKLGAKKFHDPGFVDVKGDPMGPWEDFLDSMLSSLGAEGDGPSSQEEISATVSKSDTGEALGAQKLVYGIVRENFQIADDSVGPPKRHIEIELPENTTYRTGDYLTILAYNHVDIIKRVEKRFGVRGDDKILIAGTKKLHLKTAGPIAIFELLAARVELSTPVTQRQLTRLASVAKDPKEKASIEHLAEQEVYEKEILPKRFSILDILEDYPSIDLPFASYLDMLKAMSMRQYSISSSPLSAKNLGSSTLTASLSYDVHSGGEHAHKERTFNGVASSYMANLTPGSKIHCAVSSTNAAFHLPRDPAIPIIMIAAGTGLAPMRGFIEERAAIASASGRKVGPALLYFGCRDYEKDYIYKEELEHWQELGAVSLRPVFSKRGFPSDDGTAAQKWKYVPDRMWDEREEIAKLFKDGAKIFLCGSASKLAKSTAKVCKDIYKERNGVSDEQADAWLESVREDRYVSDVFG